MGFLIRKQASMEVLETWQASRGRRGMARTAHRVAFDYAPRDGYLYVRSRMISSRTNDNHDTFPAGEIEKGYRSFLGKPVFVNHHNANHRRARGVIVAIALHRDRNPDGSPDTWVEGLMEVDAQRFPKLAKAILAGKVNRTSMGVDVEWSRCSACGNRATSPAEYCNHLPALKGKKIRKRNPSTGKVEEKLIHEVCAGLSFFENSLLVEDPADPSAFVLGTPDARGLNMPPRSASSNRGNGRSRDSVSAGNVPQGELSRSRVAASRSNPGEQFVLDDPDIGLGQRGERIPRSGKAPSSRNHVARVGRVGSQDPVERVHAQREIAGVPDDQAVGNRPAQKTPSVPVRPDARPGRVRKGEPRVARTEHSSRPRVAESRPRAEVDRGEVPVYFGDRANESSVQFGPADHNVNSSLLGRPDDRGLRASASRKTAEGEEDPARALMRHLGEAHGLSSGEMADGTRRMAGRHGIDIPSRRESFEGAYRGTLAALQHLHDSRHVEGSPHRHGPVDPLTTAPFTPTLRQSLSSRKKAAAGDPDFRDLIPNKCLDCGQPVRYRPRQGDFAHDTFSRDHDHVAFPSRPDDRTGSRNYTYGGTHCLVCREPVKINLRALHVSDGGWHHHDGIRRDHPAIPADAQAVYDSIPGQNAARDQARSQMRDRLHSQFEQMSGHPLPRRPGRGEEDMPPDPFLASKKAAAKREGGDHSFFEEHPVSSANIVSAYRDSTDNEKALGDRWYSDAHHVAKSIAHGDAALGAGLLSAYSPQTAWPVNLFNASRAALGDPPGPGTGAMGAQQKSAIRILAGEHHSAVLKAPKTAAFAHLIEHGGDTRDDEESGKHRVVIDRHAMSVAAGHRLSKEDGSRAPLSRHQHYEHVSQLYRDAAADISKATGRKVSPHQVQAATWLRQIRKNQEEDSTARGAGGKGRVKMHQNSKGRWEEHHREHHPGGIAEENMHYHGRRKTAFGETRVPSAVDTLRMEECPVCGEHDVWSGERCAVCGFIVPPSMFRDPNVNKAQQVRQELDQQGEVVTGPEGDGGQAPGTGPDGQIGSGEDADSQMAHPDQTAPDGTPGPQGGDPSRPGQDPQGLGEEEQAEGQQEEEQGEEDLQAAEQEQQEGQELEDQGTEDELEPPPGLPAPDLECPACGASYSTDVAAQPGTPCPACRQGSLQPAGGPPEGAEEDPEAEDESEEEDEGEDMPGSKTAAALAQAQARRIAQLTAQNEVLTAQLSFLASAAGVDRQLAQIRSRVMRRHADMLNPASPVPDPPEAPPVESTEQALMPAAMDDPSRPGTTPGANQGVPARQTTTAITPGVEDQTPPATNLIDVTAPVQGTNPSEDGGVPLEQRRIETDVRIDPDPLKAHGPGIGGQGDNGAAFPWLLPNGMPDQQQGGQGQPQQRQGSREDQSSRRTFASIRLAKLRVSAGLAQGEELAVAERIEKDASLPTPVIEHEIKVLSAVPQAQERQRPMQRAAARSAPSLASVGATASYAPAVSDYDMDGSDLFL